MPTRLRPIRFSLFGFALLAWTANGCSHKETVDERSEISSTDEAVSRPVDTVRSPEVKPTATPVAKPRVAKRAEAAAARTRAAVDENAPEEGSEEEYAADVDAAMGDTPAPTDMDEETLAAVNSEPDNSRVNRLSDGDIGLTADQQGNSETDIEITRKIRRTLTSNSELSTYARNVKIITRDGRVVLKGPVRSEAEQRFIEDTAVSVAGAGNVASGIEITR